MGSTLRRGTWVTMIQAVAAILGACLALGVRADTQVVASFPVRSAASGLISDSVSAPAASSPGLLDSLFYDDLEATESNSFPAASEQIEERQDILAGVNGGLVAASFLAAMTSSLLMPWVTSGVSRLLERGLPRIEITMPDNDAVKIINNVAEEEAEDKEVEAEKEEDTDVIDEMDATNKVRRSLRYQKLLRSP